MFFAPCFVRNDIEGDRHADLERRPAIILVQEDVVFRIEVVTVTAFTQSDRVDADESVPVVSRNRYDPASIFWLFRFHTTFSQIG